MREQLWRAHVPPQLPIAGDARLRRRSRGGTSCPAATSATRRCAPRSSPREEGAPLTQDHLERAVALEFRELGKLAETGVLE